MTNKELLYVDDALMQVDHFQLVCDEYQKKIKNEQLKSFVKDLSKKCCEMRGRLMSLLGGKQDD